MEYIKQIMKNEINNLNEDEVDIFKKSIEDMFKNLIDSVDNKHKEIEKSIEKSFENLKKDFYFSSTIININELKYYGDMFYPIVEEKDRYTYENILNSIKNNESVKVTKLYFENNPFDSVIEDKVFDGAIVSSEKTYEIKFKVKKFQGYKNEIKNIYKYSKNNFFDWTTPNMPYIDSFYELEIEEIYEELTQITSIDDIYYNLEELEGEYKRNLCPVWTIKKIEKMNSKDSTLVSKGMFRYKTGINKNEKVILANKDYKIHALDYDSEGILELTTNKYDLKVLNYFFIGEPKEIKNSNSEFPIWTNKKSSTFLNSYSSFYSKRVRSQGEIRRLLNSFEGAKDFILREIYVTSVNDFNNEIKTDDVNEFIIKDIRNEENKDLMIIVFHKDNQDNFTNKVLNYIVSEIQILFPEYKCVGEIE